MEWTPREGWPFAFLKVQAMSLSVFVAYSISVQYDIGSGMSRRISKEIPMNSDMPMIAIYL